MSGINLEAMFEKQKEKRENREESVKMIKKFQDAMQKDGYKNKIVRDEEGGYVVNNMSRDQLIDMVLKNFNGDFSFTIPEEKFAKKVLNSFTKSGREYNNKQRLSFLTGEDVKIEVQIIPSEFLGMETMKNSESNSFKINARCFDPSDPIDPNLKVDPCLQVELGDSDGINQYERGGLLDICTHIDRLENESFANWYESNKESFNDLEQAIDYYADNWRFLTSVNYFKENMLESEISPPRKGILEMAEEKKRKTEERFARADKDEPIDRDEFYDERFCYMKPEVLIKINDKLFTIDSDEGREVVAKIAAWEDRKITVPAEVPEKMKQKMTKLSKDQRETIERRVISKAVEAPFNNRQADSLLALIFQQAQRTIDRPIGR